MVAKSGERVAQSFHALSRQATLANHQCAHRQEALRALGV